MADLSTDIRFIKGIGEKKALAFNKLGVFTLRDLISFFPKRYEDRTQFKPIALCADGESVCINVLIAETPRLVRVRRGMELVKFKAVDDSGIVDITFFNQTYTKNHFIKGESFSFYGKIEVRGNIRTMANPAYEKDDSNKGVTGRIFPIYKLCSGLNQKNLAQSIRYGLDACADRLTDPIPLSVQDNCKLVQRRYAYENIHFPADFGALELSRRRLIFEELFILACALGKNRVQHNSYDGKILSYTDVQSFFCSLPFTPTNAQIHAINDGLSDMVSGKVMNRLVQGDVGSGKTLVAAVLMYCTVKSGMCAALMAPTEILAQQHFNTISSMLSPFGCRIALLTGSMSAKEKREIKSNLKNRAIDIIIGTHALLSEDVEYSNLGLVVTDEQHRFGVNQRSALIGKGLKPHVLVMSATPIPRTLALIIYGDLDVSIIDELPPGRQKVDTFTVDESYRERLNGFIKKLVSEGRQVFVVCPKVDEDVEGISKLKSAEEHAKELAELFPELRIGCIHGKMKSKAKEQAMSEFVCGNTDILVSTTVIEVGVDVPNATLMIIENADRFGLSQLHQLRGRVGRGKLKSWCILVSDNTSEESRARLKIMTDTCDGFKISEADLRLRGPGDFFGSRQHGLPEMHVADLGADTQILKLAQDEAMRVLKEDPELSKCENKELASAVELLFSINSNGLN